ncbi:hypothetical protein N0V85_009128 [Neurospora sp. IMI 360204]|nr:hypothetical protein N0V85_009128 [Neurospora sp. IMI 360204]
MLFSSGDVVRGWSTARTPDPSPEYLQSPTTTGRTGSLRGGTNLLGANSPQPDLDTANPQSVNGQDANADLGLYLDFNGAKPPQPNRGGRGGTYDYEKLNPDLYAPPDTDSGSTPQFMFNMGLAHNRAGVGNHSGWARQQNQ